MVGGSTDIAQSQQQANAENQAAEQAQKQQVARENAFSGIGAAYNPEGQGSLSIFGQTILGPQISTFGDALAGKVAALPPHAVQIANAISQANAAFATPEKPSPLVSFTYNGNNPMGSADKVIKALAKVTAKFQIGHVASVEEAASNLNTISKSAKGTYLEQLNAIHEALTGRDTDGFIASQESKAAKEGAKDGKLQLQTTTGLGTVPVEGGTGEANGTNAGNVQPSGVQSVGAGGVAEGSLGLQVGQPSGEGIRNGTGAVPDAGDGTTLGAGQGQVNGQAQTAATGETGENVATDTQVRGAGAPSTSEATSQTAAEARVAAARQAWEDMDGSGVSYDNVPAGLREGWERAVAEGTATGEIQEAIANEAIGASQESQASRIVMAVLTKVIQRTSRMDEATAQKKREFIAAYFGGARLDVLTQVAKDLGISPDQAKRWSAEMPKFIENNAGKLRIALMEVSKESGFSMEEMQDALNAKAEETAAGGMVAPDTSLEEADQSTSRSEEPVESDTDVGKGLGFVETSREEAPDESQVDENDANLVASNRKSASLQERYNAVETVNAAYMRTVDALDDALDKLQADPENAELQQEVVDLNAKLEKLTADATKLATNNARKGAKESKNAVQESSTEEVPVREGTGNGEAVGEGNAKKPKVTRVRKVKVEPKQESKPEEVTPPEVQTPAEQWGALAVLAPELPAYEVLSRDEKARWDDLASRGTANLAAAVRIVGNVTKPTGTALANKETTTEGTRGNAPALTDESNVIDVEARVISETVAPKVAALPAPQIDRLEKFYGLKRDTEEFLARVKEDVVTFATKGAEAVSAAIRDIIKAIHSGVLAVAMIFNPMQLSAPSNYVVVPSVETVTTQREVKAELPADVVGMSPAGQQAYATLIPAMKGKNGDKLITIVDKPSGRTYVFDANGKLIVQKKTLQGAAYGDLYKGNNDLPQNRITPAGLFGLKLIDAAKGGSAAKTAGEYDFGKVFALEDPDAVVTVMHSVWLHEKDASKRAAALQNDNAGDSRYSFGCINVDKATYKMLLDKYQEQMDGSTLFVVPDDQTKVKDFLEGNVPYDKLVRKSVTPVTETVTTTRKNATGTPEVNRAQVGKEEKQLFGKDSAVVNPYTAAELVKDISDFVRSAINTRRLKVVDSVQDLLESSDPVEQELGASIALNKAYGVAADGKAYLVANRITKGQGRAKFLHEVGAHIGMEGLLTDEQFDTLTDQIFEWASREDGSRESQLAVRAILRADAAGTPDEDLRSEVLAYFVEEAMQSGIEPSAALKLGGPLGQWFRALYAAFKSAIRRLGMNPEKLNAKDVVNMAYGAARLEMAGTYHGTAADFRRFNHKYMGTGEGAQAFGWGSYLAQSFGVAKGYWKADVERKGARNITFDGQPFAAVYKTAREEANSAKATFESIAKIDALREIQKALRDEQINSNFLYFAHLELNRIAENNPGDTDATRALKWFENNISKFEETGIQGNVMRVDVGVEQNELLDWDKELMHNDNYELKKRIQKNMSPELIEALEDEVGESLMLMTGGDFYRGLEFLEKKEGRVSEEFKDVEDYNKRLANSKAKRIVSAYLEEIVGIPGLKFLDQNSRGDLQAAEQQLKNREAQLAEVSAQADSMQAVADNWSKIYDDASAKEKAAARNTWLEYVERASQLSYQTEELRQAVKTDKKRIKKLQNPTRNLVIFNDKNIFRVGSRGGNRRENMKFGGDTVWDATSKALGSAKASRTGSTDSVAKALKLMAQAEKTKDPIIAAQLRTAAQDMLANAASRMSKGDKRMGTKFGVDIGIERLPKPLQSAAGRITTDLLYQAKKGVLASAITEDVVNMASKYMRSAADYLKAQYARQALRLRHELNVEKVLQQYDKLPKELQGTGKGSVNEFIFDSTTTGLWGYYPGEEFVGTSMLNIDKGMEARFNAFPPAAQKLIKDVFAYGNEALRDKQKAVKDAIDREFAAREKAALGDADALDKIAKDKAKLMKRESRLNNLVNSKPYAYLGRYGDFVMVAKSKEYKHYEELAEQRDPAAIAWIEQNETDPKHYVVEFAETLSEAKAVAERLGATGMYDMPEAFEKEAYADYLSSSDSYVAINRLRKMVAQEFKGSDPDALKSIDKMLGDLYLITAAESSARKSMLQRKDITGADKDMMRNMATSGRANAHFLATLQYNDEIADSINKMRQERKYNNEEATPFFNELLKRHASSMKYETPSTLSSFLTKTTSVWFLATSPAFYLQQLLQTYVLSLPYIAGRLGYFRSARAINTAYKDMAGLVKGISLTDHVDFDKAPADVRGMLQTLVGMGKIDIGVDADAKARAGERSIANRALHKLQSINTRIESINRATAAIAAYRGYLQRYGADKTEAATKFAAEVVSNTHGSYDGFNTPRIMQSNAGRVAFQFKRFQIIQLSMLAKLISTAFGKSSKEEKAVARKMLGFITAQMAAIGGVLAVPFVSQAAWILSKALGDDEPEEPEVMLRRWIGDQAVADLILRGATGAMGIESLGKKLGMENVASPFGPFAQIDMTSRSGAEKTLVAMMGASAGLGLKMADSLGFMLKGDYYRGLEMAMPNGIGNALKGYRILDEGVTRRNKDVVLKPDEISVVDAAFQAVGLPTSTITRQQFTQRVVAAQDKYYSDKAAEIKTAYVDASRDNDTAAMADARREWEELQVSRKTKGYKVQPLAELFQAVAEARKRERGVVGGVQTTMSNKRFVEAVSRL